MAESFVMYGVSSFKGFLVTASSQLSICVDQESALYLFLFGVSVPIGGRVSVWGALSLFEGPCPCLGPGPCLGCPVRVSGHVPIWGAGLYNDASVLAMLVFSCSLAAQWLKA